jgi:hypothetical protein
MSKNIVPAAIVALAVLATTAGSALAHDVIIPRQGFDTALAAVEAQQVQAPTSAKAANNNLTPVKSSTSASPFNPGASSNDDEWFKDR